MKIPYFQTKRINSRWHGIIAAFFNKYSTGNAHIGGHKNVFGDKIENEK